MENIDLDLKVKKLKKVQEAIFEEKYIYDTVYHLDEIRREIRIKGIIESLKNELS